MIHKALCLPHGEQRGPGVTLEVDSATAKLALGARAAATACLATGAMERKAANPVNALTAVIQPPDTAWTGSYTKH